MPRNPPISDRPRILCAVLLMTAITGCVRPAGPPASATPNDAAQIVDAQLEADGFGWVLSIVALSVTADFGASWTELTIPKPSDQIRSVTAHDAKHVVIAGIGGRQAFVASTSDGGATWSSTDLQTTGPPGDVRLAARPGKVFALVRDESGSNFAAGELFASTDESTWQAFAAPTAGAISLGDNDEIWIAGGPQHTELWRSPDGGQSWDRITLPLPNTGLFAIDAPHMFDGSNGLILATLSGDPAGVLPITTHDDGKSWIPASTSILEASIEAGVVLPSSIVSDDFSVIIAPDGSRIFVIENSSGTKVISPNGLASGVFAVSFADAKRGWAVTATGSCRSDKSDCTTVYGLAATTDGGQTWSEVSVPS
jgi:photosystem II stability/assembly factor-like uncharacterized protein